MRTASCLVLMFAAVAASDADAHGRHGRWWGGVSIGIGVPLYLGSRIDPWYGYPAPVMVAPPPVVYAEPAPAPSKAPPEPIFYPARGQSAAQVEADRQECNRWATTQPAAMADASVFHRATMACMDARGYTAR